MQCVKSTLHVLQNCIEKCHMIVDPSYKINTKCTHPLYVLSICVVQQENKIISILINCVWYTVSNRYINFIISIQWCVNFWLKSSLLWWPNRFYFDYDVTITCIAHRRLRWFSLINKRNICTYMNFIKLIEWCVNMCTTIACVSPKLLYGKLKVVITLLI